MTLDICLNYIACFFLNIFAGFWTGKCGLSYWPFRAGRKIRGRPDKWVIRFGYESS